MVDREVRVRSLAGSLCCVLGQDTLLSQCLSPPRSINRGTSELSGKPDEILGVTCDGLASHPGGVAILLVASCYRNRDKLRQSWATSLVRLNLRKGGAEKNTLKREEK